MLARRRIRLLRLAIIASVYNVCTVSGGSAKPHVICARRISRIATGHVGQMSADHHRARSLVVRGNASVGLQPVGRVAFPEGPVLAARDN